VRTIEREEFEQLVAKLCAGYEKPVTKHRTDAYWSGLAKMALAQFERCVDYALSDLGPQELPGAKGIWKIHRELRGYASTPRPSAPGDARDHLEHWANRLLYAHIAGRGGLGSVGEQASAELTACMKLKRELVDWFLGPIRDRDPDVTPAEFLRQWIAGLQAISRIDAATYQRWCEMLELPEYAQPFEPYMARNLTERQAAA
jgi:hypothetical protein